MNATRQACPTVPCSMLHCGVSCADNVFNAVLNAMLTLCCAVLCCVVCSNLPLTPFSGPLPPSFGDLLEPTFIDLELNYFTGTLPESWSKLTKLKTL
jgi:hypothetical protein